jgi:hypothetical protein
VFPVASSCFLGAGANGFVFQVRPVPTAASGTATLFAGGSAVAGSAAAPVTGAAGSAAESAQLLALKVVLAPPMTARAANAAQEYAALLDAARMGAPVVAPVGGSLRVRALGVGFVLREVGTPARCKSEAQCYKAFRALQLLHSFGILHGDARLQNLLSVQRGRRKVLLWIDMRIAAALSPDVSEAFAAYAFSDAVILASSILGCEALPPHIAEAVRSYTPTMPSRDLRAMTNALFAAKAHGTVHVVPEAGEEEDDDGEEEDDDDDDDDA